MTAMLETYKNLTNSLVRRVNAQRGIDKGLREAVAPRSLRQSFVQTARLAAERQLAAGILAEASQRTMGDKVVITSRHSWFADLSEADLTIASLNDGWQLNPGELPERADWHRFVYLNSPARAVFVGHPVAATAVANQPALWQESDGNLMAAEIGGVALCLAEDRSIAETAVHHQVLLIQGAGVLAWGDTLAQAVAFAETVNRWCEILLITR